METVEGDGAKYSRNSRICTSATLGSHGRSNVSIERLSATKKDLRLGNGDGNALFPSASFAVDFGTQPHTKLGAKPMWDAICGELDFTSKDAQNFQVPL